MKSMGQNLRDVLVAEAECHTITWCQRPFKFRVWYGNEMYEEVESVGVDYIGPYFQEEELGDRHYCEALMQSTGLKDKNGKEIYEGDIVDISGHYYGDNWIYQTTDIVTFEDGSYAFDSADIENCDITVIGNRFENQDLLGDAMDD